MQFAVSVLAAWIVIIILCLMPKKLTVPEMVLLFFVNSIFAISIFTTTELNLQYIVVADNVDRKFALMAGHVVGAPLLLVMAGNMVLYRNPFRWCLIIIIWFIQIAMQYLMKWLGVLKFVEWNIGYSVLESTSLIIFAVAMARVVKWISRRDVNPHDHIR